MQEHLDGVRDLAPQPRRFISSIEAPATTGIPVDDIVNWGWLATGASVAVWDYEGWHDSSGHRYVATKQSSVGLATTDRNVTTAAVSRRVRQTLLTTGARLGDRTPRDDGARRHDRPRPELGSSA
jgi:hypothetical protein